MTAPAMPPGVNTHELSHGFEWLDHAGPARLLTNAQLEQFDRDGFVLLDRVIPSDVVDRVIAEIDPFEAEMEQLVRGAGGKLFIARADEITFTVHLVARSPLLRSFVAAPLFRDLTFDIVGPDVRLYWDQSVYKKPHTDAPFPWHQDNGYTFVEPQAYLTCWIALTDTDERNGCPWVVPGLHRHGTFAHRLTDLGFVCLDDAPTAVPVAAPAGSIVVFSSLTPHCTGPNTTDEVRKSYIVQYAPHGAHTTKTGADGVMQRAACDAAERQFPILEHGTAADDAPAGWLP